VPARGRVVVDIRERKAAHSGVGTAGGDLEQGGHTSCVGVEGRVQLDSGLYMGTRRRDDQLSSLGDWLSSRGKATHRLDDLRVGSNGLLEGRKQRLGELLLQRENRLG
jgi:hypothetical protein